MRRARCWSLGAVALWLVGLMVHDVHAQSVQQQFFQANQHYASGRYEEAARGYESLLQAGVETGNLYYNLGNAYFKLGRKGKAIANYLRARKAMPHDGDVFANLNFVTSLLEEAQIEESLGWPQRLFAAMRDALTPGGWFGLCAALFWLVCVILGVCVFRVGFRKTGGVLSAALLVVWGLGLFFFGHAAAHVSKRHLAVIIEPTVEVRYSPSYSGALAFELHEGLQVRIVRQEGQWTHVRLTRDKSGWVPSTSLEKL